METDDYSGGAVNAAEARRAAGYAGDVHAAGELFDKRDLKNIVRTQATHANPGIVIDIARNESSIHHLGKRLP